MMKKTIQWNTFGIFGIAATTRKQIKCWSAFTPVLLLVGAIHLTGCATDNDAYFNQETTGNAWATTLPAGTQIIVKDEKTLAPAFTEIKDGKLLSPCVLVSVEYLNKRDEREVEQLYMIKELKIKKDVP